jgi:hypothetical protein
MAFRRVPVFHTACTIALGGGELTAPKPSSQREKHFRLSSLFSRLKFRDDPKNAAFFPFFILKRHREYVMINTGCFGKSEEFRLLISAILDNKVES